jgi:hypothetical protein
MSKNPYDSDFGAIFKQRYEKDILDDRNIKKSKVKKGLLGAAAGGIGAGLMSGGNPLAAGIGTFAGDKTEDSLSQKMEKEDESGMIKAEKMEKEAPLPTDADTMKSLRKAIGSIDSILQKLDSCDGAKAGLNIKKVTQGKEHVFKPKTPPKPKTKKA